MRNIKNLKIFQTKRLTVFAAVLSFVLLTGIAVTGTVHADPPNSNLTTVKYCQAHMPQKAQGGCTEGNMDRIRASVKNDCAGQSGLDACVEKAAEKVINQVAAQHPNSKGEFNNALNSILENSGDGGCQGAGCPASPTGQGKNCDNNHCDLIGLYVNPTIKILSIIVGLVVAASLVMGGIQYTTSSGDPQKTSAAKTRITNSLLAFLAYAFMFAFLNFLVPGGLFN